MENIDCHLFVSLVKTRCPIAFEDRRWRKSIRCFESLSFRFLLLRLDYLAKSSCPIQSILICSYCSSVERAWHLLRLSWYSAHQIMERAVDFGLAKRSEEVTGGKR